MLTAAHVLSDTGGDVFRPQGASQENVTIDKEYIHPKYAGAGIGGLTEDKDIALVCLDSWLVDTEASPLLRRDITWTNPTLRLVGFGTPQTQDDVTDLADFPKAFKETQR